ncbi:RidA family protein [Novipirellula artificiosorum]|uniref:Enamine/imine deaminase n=1 Tax=Novipirellula artificiosorum TaxID=2528016 RepID=A0A5C6D8K7_9BACT|nr:RidA family protein [Novipirellula artificiosorum]TWU31189.1 Enamine/imine deaminase [Novipirellula artificiosorum]
MKWRMVAAAACMVVLNIDSAEETLAAKTATSDVTFESKESVDTPIEYVPLDAPAGMSQAVIVKQIPLVHTRQLFPLDRAGELVGKGKVDEQIQQVLDNLEAVLKDSASGMDQLVRVNVYALSTAILTRFQQQLGKRLDPSVRPAITSILTPLAPTGALVAIDVVAGSAENGKTVNRKRCQAVAGEEGRADAAVLPAGSIAYLSGQPDAGGLTESATTRSMSKLIATLEHLKLSPQHVVQVKVFLKPMTSAEAVQAELSTFFPDQMTPPVVFVEWLASMPVEIEMIAQLPSPSKSAQSERPSASSVEYFTPPEVRPSHTFSKVALMRADKQIYLSGLYAHQPSRGEPQAVDLFDRLQLVLAKTGSDMRHLVKATYYVSDDDAARWIDRTRPRLFDPTRPPAASKVMIHGVGLPQRTMAVDMIAVAQEK